MLQYTHTQKHIGGKNKWQFSAGFIWLFYWPCFRHKTFLFWHVNKELCLINVDVVFDFVQILQQQKTKNSWAAPLHWLWIVSVPLFSQVRRLAWKKDSAIYLYLAQHYDILTVQYTLEKRAQNLGTPVCAIVQVLARKVLIWKHLALLKWIVDTACKIASNCHVQLVIKVSDF